MAKKTKREEAELDPEAKTPTQKRRKNKKPKKDKGGQTVVDDVPTVAAEEDEAEQVLENEVGKVKEAQQCDLGKTDYERNTVVKKNKREEEELDPEADISTQKRKKKKKPKKDKLGQTVVDNVHTVVEEEDEAEQVENGSNDVGKVKETQQCDTGKINYERNTIAVSGMPYTTKEEEIREMFKDCGSISRLELTNFPDTGKFKGVAFVRFETQDAAKSAIVLHGMKMEGRFLKIEPYRNHQKKEKKLYTDPPAKVNGCLSAYVGNLPRDIKEDEIREHLKDSKIKSIRLALDRKKVNCRGFCHVFFDDDESLENAIKKNQQELHGRSIKIAYSVNY